MTISPQALTNLDANVITAERAFSAVCDSEVGPFGATDELRTTMGLGQMGSRACIVGFCCSRVRCPRIRPKVQPALFRLSRGLAQAQQFWPDVQGQRLPVDDGPRRPHLSAGFVLSDCIPHDGDLES